MSIVNRIHCSQEIVPDLNGEIFSVNCAKKIPPRIVNNRKEESSIRLHVLLAIWCLRKIRNLEKNPSEEY